MRRISAILALLTVLIAMAAGTMITPVSAQGNSEAAKRCQHGGWQDLQGSDGERFADQGECVSYASQGGHLSAVVVEPIFTVEWVTRSFESGEVQFSAIVTGAGLQPGAGLDFYLHGILYPGYDELATVEADGTLYYDRTSVGWVKCGGFNSAYYQTLDRNGEVIRSTDGVAASCP